MIIFFLLYFPLNACNQQNHSMESLDKRLDSIVPVLLQQNNVPDVSLAVIRNGTVSSIIFVQPLNTNQWKKKIL